ncbi:hypothetical protein HanRHA438_Chr04g0176751 [Helianthus annuus]|nr:hypothetical protein HanRHA438_Chr04g0176751 [Helianthus annuus]
MMSFKSLGNNFLKQLKMVSIDYANDGFMNACDGSLIQDPAYFITSRTICS